MGAEPGFSGPVSEGASDVVPDQGEMSTAAGALNEDLDQVAFDGSLISERVAGESSARCSDERARTLALTPVGEGGRVQPREPDAAVVSPGQLRGRATSPGPLDHVPPEAMFAVPDVRLLSDADLRAPTK